ncbi:hypothetical protein NON20_21680 [Synechocystis sp. B12]|nr:hypothetical protein NON20_21680 [Synechocystis sp. B12]
MFALPILAVAGTFPTYFVAVYVVGLVAAVSIGLVAGTIPNALWVGKDQKDQILFPKLTPAVIRSHPNSPLRKT